MNNIFSFRRFGNYCLKQVNEWVRGIFLQFISLAGIYTILMLVFRFGDNDSLHPYIASTEAQAMIWLSFFVYIAKMSSNLSVQIGSRSRLTLYLTVPASTLEKYMAHLLSVLVLYPLIFFAGITVAQYGSEFLSTLIRQETFNPGMPLEGCFAIWDNPRVDLFGIRTFWLWTFSIVTLFTLGATIWKRGAFLKTIAAMVMINVIAVFVLIVSINSGELVGFAMMIDNFSFVENEEDIMNILVFSSYISVVVFALIGYMRMKELEVNETKI